MKRLYYGLALAIIIAIAGKSLLQATVESLTKSEEENAIQQFIKDMQVAVDNDDEQKAKEILANAKATIPSFTKVDPEDKDNAIALLENSLEFFHPIKMIEE